MPIFDWAMLDHVGNVVALVGCILLLALKYDLRRCFATKEEIVIIERRIAAFEREQRHSSRGIEQRLLASEITLAKVDATVAGMRDAIEQTRKGVDMLVRHHIEREGS